MATTLVDLLEEASRDLVRAQGRILTALAPQLETQKEKSVPNSETIKQFLATVVIPPLAGALSTWIFTSVHFLSIFHVTAGQTAKAVTELAVFGVTAGLAWLTSHHVLKGTYSPAAKARVGK